MCQHRSPHNRWQCLLCVLSMLASVCHHLCASIDVPAPMQPEEPTQTLATLT
ncbi:hypothetical protein BDP55DRAFT_678190 [Colletotrichum godetiae]|uniref:Uncharacterized protein n=1 Tax=Colletotrichum godetiae TaxID=1209918 RepID=A0AAJ0ESV9_9PEZI|nr:uncharacterized protein BDP55DRAFT_678190 [Colletotrichum godetiae]KAK1659883.1 hypothetical protein BDP55DRAFT_678190 [Colletotrichum godetiae]